MIRVATDSNSDGDDDDVSSLLYWQWGVVLYMASFVGDLFDGWAARKLDQTSSYGSVLDMVTDRCATMGFLFILALEFSHSPVKGNRILAPWSQVSACLGLALLDIASHWFQMYASLAVSTAHHKSEKGNEGRHFLVQWFYKYYWFFGYLCVGTEFSYILVYIQCQLDQTSTNPLTLLGLLPLSLFLVQRLVSIALSICLPACFLKQLVNVAQLCSACHAIAVYDAQLHNHQKRTWAMSQEPQPPQSQSMMQDRGTTKKDA